MRIPKKNWIWIARDYKKENGPYKTRDYLFQKHIDDFFYIDNKKKILEFNGFQISQLFHKNLKENDLA